MFSKSSTTPHFRHDKKGKRSLTPLEIQFCAFFGIIVLIFIIFRSMDFSKQSLSPTNPLNFEIVIESNPNDTNTDTNTNIIPLPTTKQTTDTPNTGHNTNPNTIRMNERALQLQEALADDHYHYMRGWQVNGALHGAHHKRLPIHVSFHKFNAYYPCLWGEFLLKYFTDVTDSTSVEQYKEHLFDNKDIAKDGAKYACGAHLIQHNEQKTETDTGNGCVAYSIGSNNNFEFELGLLGLNSGCRIYVWDHTVGVFTVPESIKENVETFKIGITHRNDAVSMLTLDKMMEKLGHRYVDILKIDVESNEYLSLFYLDKFGLFPSVGQLLLEIHLDNVLPSVRPELDEKLIEWGYFDVPVGGITDDMLLNETIVMIERHGLRMFHREVNEWGPNSAIEYAFIQQHWRPERTDYRAVDL